MSAQAIPLLTLTRTLSGTVAANVFVTPAGATAGAGANAIGVSRVAGVSGDKVPVDAYGTAYVLSGAAVTVNATLKADAAGKAIDWVTSGAKIAIALQAAGAADQLIEVLLIPNAA
jgi:S-adenosylmethionine synthetase